MDARGEGDAGVDIRTAARVLGLTVAATRKRILRGTLEAYKVDGAWRVVLPMSHATGGDSGQTTHATWAVDAAAARIAELEDENLRLWRLVEAQQVTIHTLSERAQLPPPAPGERPPEPLPNWPTAAPRRPWWAFWQRGKGMD